MKYVLLLLAALPAASQKLHVYSPLTRVDPAGEIVKPDRGSAPPRHILSPGVPRNAWSSFRVVVELEKPESFILDIGQNPENSAKAILYRENFVETAAGFLPDTLQQVNIPYRGGAWDFRVPGQRVVSFWLDLWVDRNAEVDRVKIEPQLFLESLQDWVVYPMEVRIQQPVVPDLAEAFAARLPDVTAPADAVVRGPLRASLCGSSEKQGSKPGRLTGRDLFYRNVRQHLRLAPPPTLPAIFTKSTGIVDVKGWCAAPLTPAAGAEWYLKFRDAIYRQAGATD